MTTKRKNIARIINGLAAAISLLVALSLPVGCGLVVYTQRGDELSFKAEIKAAALSLLIAAAPIAGRRGPSACRAGSRARRSSRLTSRFGSMTSTAPCSPTPASTWWPLLTRSSPLFDAERVVGSVEVSGSLRGAAPRMLAVVLVGLLLGALVFFVVQVLPLRALRRVTGALLEEKGQGEALLKTLQRREAALRESEARFRALHDASFGGIAIHEDG